MSKIEDFNLISLSNSLLSRFISYLRKCLRSTQSCKDHPQLSPLPDSHRPPLQHMRQQVGPSLPRKHILNSLCSLPPGSPLGVQSSIMLSFKSLNCSLAGLPASLLFYNHLTCTEQPEGSGKNLSHITPQPCLRLFSEFHHT